MSDLRKLLADAGAWIASSEAPGSAEVAAEIEAALAATTAEPGPAAQRLEAFLESLPRSRERTQALIDYGTVLHDRIAALAVTPAASLDVERLAKAIARLGGWYHPPGSPGEYAVNAAREIAAEYERLAGE